MPTLARTFPTLARAFLLTFAAAVVAAGTLAAQPDAPSVARQNPQEKRLESVLGREVRTRVEDDGGRIIDLLADRNGRVQAAVIEFGGFLGIGTRKIAVEWSALRFELPGDRGMITVDVTREQLRAAPEYKPSDSAVVRRISD